MGLNTCPPDGGDVTTTPETNAAVDTGEPDIPNADNPKKNLTSEERMALINDRAESNAMRRVQEYETNYNMHTIERHGSQIPDADDQLMEPTLAQELQVQYAPVPSSQFTSYRLQMHAVNNALTRQTRGLPAHTHIVNGKPVVRGELPSGGGRGYQPRSYDGSHPDQNNPIYNGDMKRYEVKLDPITKAPFTAHPIKN